MNGWVYSPPRSYPTEKPAMSWTESQRCRFRAYPDANGKPDRVYIESDVTDPSLLAHKQIGRIFLALQGSLSWREADALVEDLNRRVSRLCINHAAAGEKAA